ncbi:MULTISPECIES: hypothetical protein, partial [unclassified Microcoleus]|uniref:hypothetical protein n=1 Tax=unclassified Microcoleus TaxID=2642155 RepID=UPI002FD36764
DFKVPKAFRPQLFTCYPLTVQDSIYRFYSIFIIKSEKRSLFCSPQSAADKHGWKNGSRILE